MCITNCYNTILNYLSDYKISKENAVKAFEKLSGGEHFSSDELCDLLGIDMKVLVNPGPLSIHIFYVSPLRGRVSVSSVFMLNAMTVFAHRLHKKICDCSLCSKVRKENFA